ncbi:MAG: ADOP family duplicated permease [bacterium]
MLESLSRDLRYAGRSLRREPTFAAGIVFTFALAIGTNAAMFGLVTRLMLSPPPGIRQADRVVRVQLERSGRTGEPSVLSTMSYPAFRAFDALTGAFSAVAAVRRDTAAVGRGAELTQAAVVQASGKYFTALGTTPQRGRFFGPTDDELPRGALVVVLSYAYWKSHFAGDNATVGRTLVIDGDPFTVIGVAPRDFTGDDIAPADLFIPLAAGQRRAALGWWRNEHLNLVTVVARLADRSTPQQAAAMSTAAIRARETATSEARIAARLDALVPDTASGQSPQAKIALWLAGVSLIVLLIATANVGTLLLLRAARRRRDTAVRVALGAAHAQLARQAVAESVLLAFAGAAVGVLLSRWFGEVLRAMLLPNIAPTETFIDQRVLVGSVVAATGVGIAAGVIPYLHVRRANVSVDLRSGAGHGSSGRFGFQSALVGVQVALCTLLLIGAGLFVRSLQRVQNQDLGFSTAELLYVTLDFQVHLPAADQRLAYEAAVQRVKVVTGVSDASVVDAIPFGPHHIPPISIPGMSEMPGAGVQIPLMYGATPSYLKMMGVTLRQGRLFTDADRRGTQLVVLVNETMARTVWPGESAIGKCVSAGFPAGGFDPDLGNPAAGLPCREVVGVVRDSRARSLRPNGVEEKLMQYYVPIEQIPPPPMPNFVDVNGILVRTVGDAGRVAGPVQRAIQGGTVVPVFARVRAYQDLLDPQLRSWRLGATLFTAFSALALGIASVGLFAVVSYLFTQRTQEIGIRLALGATRSLIWQMVVRDALRLVVVGIAVGCGAAIVAGPAVRGMLFQTSPWEPANLATAVAVLLTVSVGAALRPAWRAGRVDPLIALRSEA